MAKRFIKSPPISFFFGRLMVITLIGCDVKVSTGTKKDFTTGLTTTYKNMEPGKIFMVMND
jgi:hypothetical protein